MKPKRLAHCLGVADTARALACRHGVDPVQAELAGVLHDWDKRYNDEEVYARACAMGIELPDADLSCLGPVLHAFTGAVAVRERFPGLPDGICQAIARHTTGAPDMAPLDMVLYVADMIEPSRKAHDDIAALREMALREDVSLEELFFAAYAATITYLVRCRFTLYPGTLEIYNHYALRYRDALVASGEIWRPGQYKE